MSRNTTTFFSLFIVFAAFFGFSTDAYAGYMDPGTGSFMIQMLAASLVGAIYTLKVYFRRIIGFFKGSSSDSGLDVAPEQEDSKDHG